MHDKLDDICMGYIPQGFPNSICLQEVLLKTCFEICRVILIFESFLLTGVTPVVRYLKSNEYNIIA